jgi:fructokinase
MGKADTKRPVIFGEVLFDVFPDGKEVLGGAPFNVAWNLAGLGARPLLISKIGKDERGKAVLAAMARFGMDVSGVQIDKFLPTGRVAAQATPVAKKFGVPEAQAFDAIDKAKALEAAESVDAALLYHGTLISRSRVSLDALDALKKKMDCPIYVDVNMRAPWVKGETAVEMIKGATWAQAAKPDFDQMLGSVSFVGLDRMGMVGYLRDMSGVKALIMTMGKEGAIMGSQTVSIEIKQKSLPQVVDTIGCGDAFAAVAISGLMNGWPLEQTVDRANEFAAGVCKLKGAVTEERKFYSAKAAAWGLG